MDEDLVPTMGESSNKGRHWIKRQISRVTVPKALTVKIELVVPEGTRWSARCINIHIAGVLLEFAPNNIPDVKVASKVLVTIQLDGEVAAKIPAFVRYRVARRLGLFFPDLSTQAPKQEDSLSRIIRTIERKVLRKR